MTLQERLLSARTALKGNPDLAPQIVGWSEQHARPATIEPVPGILAPALHDMLTGRGIVGLYAHQAEAIRHALDGEHTVVVSPTASGKTLCYLLPVLEKLIESGQTSLLLFPTKALARDQLQRIGDDLESLGLDRGLVAAYDGDTGPAARAAARNTARILVTNPDMLHAGILPNHTRWRELIGDLAYVVMDEMHTYRGVFGSQVAGVIWRLRRLCRFYGSDPRFICTSATVSNPGELAGALLGDSVVLVNHSGALEPDRTIVLYNPPITNKALGIRRAPAEDARLLVRHLIAHGLQTVCFCRSRLAVEQLVMALRQDAERLGVAPDMIRGYRAGYRGEERRAIEAGLRDGRVQCVIATSALELGIDIGGLSACVLVGYPGSTSSFWQRIGRVGRGAAGGISILVADASPLDQYLLAHQHLLLGAAPEAARVNTHNLHVRVGQLRCALYELPLQAGEVSEHTLDEPILQALVSQGEARPSGGRWHWSAGTFPAGELSLRTADSSRVEIIAAAQNGDRGVVIGQVEAGDAPRWVHPSAIYLHEGTQYLVRSLDLEAGVAQVEPVTLPYITVASERTEITIEHTVNEEQDGALDTCFGSIRVVSRVTSYRREHVDTHQVLSRERLDMPEQEFFTDACWLGVGRELIESLDGGGLWAGDQPGGRGPNWQQQRALALARDEYRCRHCGAAELPGRSHDVHHIVPFQTFGWVPGENDAYLLANRLDNLVTLCSACHHRAEQQVAIAGTLTDLAYVLRYLIPLWVLCDPGDIGTHVEQGRQGAGDALLFIYDRAPGGSGIAEALPPLTYALLDAARERVLRCDCEAGCPSCIGPAISPQPERKQRVISLLDRMRRGT